MSKGNEPTARTKAEKVVPIRPGMSNQVSPETPSQKPTEGPGRAKPTSKGSRKTGPNLPPRTIIDKLKNAAIKAGASPVTSPVTKTKRVKPKRDPNSLTSKQEAFCVAYVAGANASDAYRAAYDTSNHKPSTIHETACRLLANPKLHSRIQILRDELAKHALVTLDSLTNELDEAMEMARGTKQPAIMIQASLAKAKMHGLMIERVENRTNFVVEAPPQDATTEDWLAAVAPEKKRG